MCTYRTEHVAVSGSAKGSAGWFAVTDASVYFDHPVHAAFDHTLNVDLLNPERGPSARVAFELDAECARELARAILETLDSLPVPGHGTQAVTSGPSGLERSRADESLMRPRA